MILRGVVLAAGADGVHVVVGPPLSTADSGPLQTTVDGLTQGDRVLVAAIGTRRDDLVIIGKVQ